MSGNLEKSGHCETPCLWLCAGALACEQWPDKRRGTTGVPIWKFTAIRGVKGIQAGFYDTRGGKSAQALDAPRRFMTFADDKKQP
jgi:hypothetical protein